MATPPRYLFRCWSDQSNGTNTHSLFAPGSISAKTTADRDDDFIPLDDNIGQQLRQALLWKKDQQQCPFVFFTTSPLFAVQLAVWRSKRQTFRDGSVAEPDTGINVTIIDTRTTTTVKGATVQYRRVKDLLSIHNVELTNRGDGSRRWYEDVWIATTEVHLGSGSFYTTFEDLIRYGLYELYPAIEVANERRDPRLELAVRDLRGYLFDETEGGGGESEQSDRLGKTEELDTAARLVLTFRPCVKEEEEVEGVGVRMAFVLALRKRLVESTTFRNWIQDHVEDISGPTYGSESVSDVYDIPHIPDAKQFADLCQHFDGMAFQLESFLIGSAVDLAQIEEEKGRWAVWWQKSRDEYRAAHPHALRPGRRGRQRNQRADRRMQLVERRARRDSAVPRAAEYYAPSYLAPEPHRLMEATYDDRDFYRGPGRVSEQREPFDTPADADAQLKELFPGWERHSARRQDYRRHEHYDREFRRRHGGYQVISSRLGDIQTTQFARQREEPRRRAADRPKDRDGGWAKRKPFKTGRRGEMRY